jgi:hypothetical protein
MGFLPGPWASLRPFTALFTRTGDGWHMQTLHETDQLVLPEFGLACATRDVCRDTPLG